MLGVIDGIDNVVGVVEQVSLVVREQFEARDGVAQRQSRLIHEIGEAEGGVVCLRTLGAEDEAFGEVHYIFSGLRHGIRQRDYDVCLRSSLRRTHLCHAGGDEVAVGIGHLHGLRGHDVSRLVAILVEGKHELAQLANVGVLLRIDVRMAERVEGHFHVGSRTGHFALHHIVRQGVGEEGRYRTSRHLALLAIVLHGEHHLVVIDRDDETLDDGGILYAGTGIRVEVVIAHGTHEDAHEAGSSLFAGLRRRLARHGGESPESGGVAVEGHLVSEFRHTECFAEFAQVVVRRSAIVGVEHLIVCAVLAAHDDVFAARFRLVGPHRLVVSSHFVEPEARARVGSLGVAGELAARTAVEVAAVGTGEAQQLHALRVGPRCCRGRRFADAESLREFHIRADETHVYIVLVVEVVAVLILYVEHIRGSLFLLAALAFFAEADVVDGPDHIAGAECQHIGRSIVAHFQSHHALAG